MDVGRGRSGSPSRSIVQSLSDRCSRMLGIPLTSPVTVALDSSPTHASTNGRADDHSVESNAAVVVAENQLQNFIVVDQTDNGLLENGNGVVDTDGGILHNTLSDEEGDVFLDAIEDSVDEPLNNSQSSAAGSSQSRPITGADRPVLMCKLVQDEAGNTRIVKSPTTVLFSPEQRELWEQHTMTLENFYDVKLASIQRMQRNSNRLTGSNVESSQNQSNCNGMSSQVPELTARNSAIKEVLELKTEIECLNTVISHLRTENESLKKKNLHVVPSSPKTSLADKVFRTKSVKRASLNLTRAATLAKQRKSNYQNKTTKPKTEVVPKAKQFVVAGKAVKLETVRIHLGKRVKVQLGQTVKIPPKAVVPVPAPRPQSKASASASTSAMTSRPVKKFRVDPEDLRRSERTTRYGARTNVSQSRALVEEPQPCSSRMGMAVDESFAAPEEDLSFAASSLGDDTEEGDLTVLHDSFRIKAIRGAKRTNRGEWKFSS